MDFFRANLIKIGFLVLSTFIGSSVEASKTSVVYSTQNGSKKIKKSDCSGLNGDEQQFAYGLTPENRQMFCKQFTPVQRAAAMQITSQPDPTGALISPDQAVERVAAANNLTPSTSNPGNCPTKK